LFYVDLDSVVENYSSFANTEEASQLAEVHKDANNDVLFSGGFELGKYFWQVKGREYYVRNTVFGRRFFLAWLHWRCGFKDQYSLWHTILKFADSANCIIGKEKYNDDIFSFDYREAGSLHSDKHYAALPQKLQINYTECQRQCQNFTFCCNEKYDLHLLLQPRHLSCKDDILGLTFWYTDYKNSIRNFTVESICSKATSHDDRVNNLISVLHLDIIYPAAII